MVSEPATKWLPALRARLSSRLTFLVLACLSLPLCCWGSGILVQGFLPIPHSDFKVVNQTNDLLYITPIDTTPGRAVVIEQPLAFRQRDIPLHPGDSTLLVNYGELHTLSGIVVCRTGSDCRLATVTQWENPADPSKPYALPILVYTLDSFENLPALEANLYLALQSHRRYSFDVVLGFAACLIPAALFLRWLYLVLKQRSSRKLPESI